MTKFAKRFSQRVTTNQREYLESVKTRTGVDINTQIMQLIQKALDKEIADNTVANLFDSEA